MSLVTLDTLVTKQLPCQSDVAYFSTSMAIQVVIEFTRKSPVGSSWLNSYNMQHTEYYLFSVTASTPLQHEHNYTYIDIYSA